MRDRPGVFRYYWRHIEWNIHGESPPFTINMHIGKSKQIMKKPPRDWLKGVLSAYDTVVIGSGLAGMTSANLLAKLGHKVLLAEHHYNMGGMATWFKRKGGHVMDISLHGFPCGMIKTLTKILDTGYITTGYPAQKNVRFDNPQFSVSTSFDKVDFTHILRDRFGILREVIDEFFLTVRDMNFYDEVVMTTRELFEKYFPGPNRCLAFSYGADHLCKWFYSR